ncbi:hypothetical protein ONS95_001371 [Cadophora gregata]|uniref:uncharacterized protein n=1 Tax=Cadophora gregata TaxID=51156 RepID=UPI0026DC255A|nr:uncharacterized protein ONS95_001371 [Cadophora gregata]KAK0110990.1 hypothetical protein ONS95_001371 [Cadophora gregata]
MPGFCRKDNDGPAKSSIHRPDWTYRFFSLMAQSKVVQIVVVEGIVETLQLSYLYNTLAFYSPHCRELAA